MEVIERRGRSCKQLQ